MKIWWRLHVEKVGNTTRAEITGQATAREKPANRTRKLPYGVVEIRYYNNPDAASQAGARLATGAEYV